MRRGTGAGVLVLPFLPRRERSAAARIVFLLKFKPVFLNFILATWAIADVFRWRCACFLGVLPLHVLGVLHGERRAPGPRR